MTEPHAAIEIQGLTKDYQVGFWHKRPVHALADLSFTVGRGEVFGFLGPNGAGKTTTLKLLMGLMFPTSGTASILGRPVSDVGMHRLIGYLPEQPYFYDYLTARELLDYFARFFGFDAPDRRARISRSLAAVGLAGAADVQLRRFSKGMLQRVGLAQAILHDPDVVFMDEPMSGLDPIGRREVRDLILDLKQRGRTVFFSTHILSDAETLCDRVAVLVGGRLQGVGSPEAIMAIKVQGMEVLFELPPAASVPPAWRDKVSQLGPRYRLEVAEQTLYDALDGLRAARARVLSVTQLKPTLEDYFMQLVDREAKAAGYAVELSDS